MTRERKIVVILELVQELVACELHEALSTTNGGAPSDAKEKEMAREKNFAQLALLSKLNEYIE